ncbi:MAG: transporter substrate-binding domain-containing protein [Microvirga sp.]|jgi:ABC-type amino acid transport substrate-binding protein
MDRLYMVFYCCQISNYRGHRKQRGVTSMNLGVRHRPGRLIVSVLLATLAVLQLREDVAMAQDLSPDLVRAIAPTGKLRAAINYGNIVLAQQGAGGEPAGVSADLARELGRRLHVPVVFTTFETAGKVVEALDGPTTWDMAFLAVDPHRAETIAFTAPYVIIEGAYMVPAGSPLTQNDQVDRPGVRIAVGRNTAYDLYLGRHRGCRARLRAHLTGCCGTVPAGSLGRRRFRAPAS